MYGYVSYGILVRMRCGSSNYVSHVHKWKRKMRKMKIKKWFQVLGLFALAVADVCIYSLDYMLIKILLSLEW